MPAIQLVVCDMAGTTVKDDNEVQACFQKAAAETHLIAPEDRVTAMMGWPKKRVFQTLWAEQLGEDHANYFSNVEASFNVFKIILEEHYRTQPVSPTEGCLELFDWLKTHKIKIALTTGFYREVTDIILQRLGWNMGLNDQYVGSVNSIIQVSVTPSEIFQHEGRPAPFMLQKAMYRLGITDPKSVINIGDTPSDLEFGLNANCLFSFGITNGTHTREQLSQYPSHGLLDSLHALKAKIERLI